MSSISVWSNPVLKIIVILVCIITISSSKSQSAEKIDEPLAQEIFQRANSNIENGNYEKAAQIYRQFIEKFSAHPYADDAAYRFAYLHVIAEEGNPYFDYKKAKVFFENLIETYPNSRYIMACKNWLNLLRSNTPASVDPVVIKVKENADPATINRLKAEIRTLQEENEKLRRTLDELQRAIER